jgi:hypothetical protein
MASNSRLVQPWLSKDLFHNCSMEARIVADELILHPQLWFSVAKIKRINRWFDVCMHRRRWQKEIMGVMDPVI